MSYVRKEVSTKPELRTGFNPGSSLCHLKIRLLWFVNEGHQRPSELQRKIPEASRRMLNVQLNELEAHDLVTKFIYPVLPPKVEYSLTEFGKTLIPVIAALGKWGDDNEKHLRDVISSKLINSTV